MFLTQDELTELTGYRQSAFFAAEAAHVLRMLAAENDKLRDLMNRAEPIVNAAENLVKVKGRFHSEQAYLRLVASMDEALK